jgi:mercuric ion transport protein
MKPTSKGGVGLVGLAGIACVACCALPVLITAGLVSGGAAAFMADKMPVIAIVLAVSAVATLAIAARRKATGKTGCGDSCDSPGGCGCTPAGA